MLYNQFVTILSNTNWYDDRFKILMTLGTIVKHQSSHLAYKLNPSMHKITNLWKFELNIGRRSGEIIKKKNLVTRSCVLKMFDFETSKSNFEVSKSTSWKITIFSKTTLHQRESYLTMFYTINLSLWLVTNTSKVYATDYFELLPIVSSPFKHEI